MASIYDSGNYSISDLAEVFSVSRPTVYRTLARQRPALRTGSSPSAFPAAHRDRTFDTWPVMPGRAGVWAIEIGERTYALASRRVRFQSEVAGAVAKSQ
jgi:hypothetical protein